MSLCRFHRWQVKCMAPWIFVSFLRLRGEIVSCMYCILVAVLPCTVWYKLNTEYYSTDVLLLALTYSRDNGFLVWLFDSPAIFWMPVVYCTGSTVIRTWYYPTGSSYLCALKKQDEWVYWYTGTVRDRPVESGHSRCTRILLHLKRVPVYTSTCIRMQKGILSRKPHV